MRDGHADGRRGRRVPATGKNYGTEKPNDTPTSKLNKESIKYLK